MLDRPHISAQLEWYRVHLGELGRPPPAKWRARQDYRGGITYSYHQQSLASQESMLAYHISMVALAKKYNLKVVSRIDDAITYEGKFSDFNRFVDRSNALFMLMDMGDRLEPVPKDIKVEVRKKRTGTCNGYVVLDWHALTPDGREL